MTEIEALVKIAEALQAIAKAIEAFGGMLAVYLFLFLLFKNMGGKS